MHKNKKMNFIQKLNANNLTTKLVFFLVVFSWSTSWIVIKFQLGIVPESLSVAYRFFGASLILFIIALYSKINLKFSRRQHWLIFLQGAGLFFLNHFFFYSAIHYVSTGVAATFSASAVMIMPIMDYFLHKNKVSKKLIFAGILGIIGLAIISSSEINTSDFDFKILLGLIFCICGATAFSFGSLIGKELGFSNIKTLISATAFSMLYGSSLSFFLVVFRGSPITFDFSFSYIASLLYLILLPGIVGYCGILFLIEKIGASKSSYTGLLYPAFALIISGIFENYHFTYLTFLGMILVASGNFIALKTRQNKQMIMPSGSLSLESIEKIKK